MLKPRALVSTGGWVGLVAVLCVAPFPARGSAGEQPRITAAEQALVRTTAFMRSISTEGGFVYLYTPDLRERTAERPARATQIAIQPPGTPSMGMAFLRAYRATKNPIFLDAARDAAAALARCRLGSGGWHATADFDPARPNEDGRLYDGEKYIHGQIIKHTIHTTFDDDTTQSAVRFLAEMAVATRDSSDPRDNELHRTLDLALRGMIRAQYPNGAWPQVYRGEERDAAAFPVRKASIPKDCPRTWPDADYTPYYTLNDHCQSDCIRTMLEAWKLLQKPECLESVRRGADFLLLAQLPDPQPAWAQQYNFAMEPAWARVHEMPAVSSCESAGAIEVLLDVHRETGDARYLQAAGSAVDWLERSAIRPGRWARLYELQTNRPVYGDGRGGFLYRKEEQEGKFSASYTWESGFGIPGVIARYERTRNSGGKVPPADVSTPEMNELESSVDKIIASLDAAGRWITPQRWKKGAEPQPVISTKVYIKNVETLADYLERMSLR